LDKGMNGAAAARGRMISQAFVFLLLGVFAVFSTLMVLLGAQLYRSIVAQTEIHSERRILCSYIANAARGSNAADVIRVENCDGIDVLVFCRDEDGEDYETKIYCHEGMLKELYLSADQSFDPEYGEAICRAEAFRPEIDGRELRLYVEDAQGEARTIRMALTCMREDNL